MPDLQGTSNPQHKEQVGAADWCGLGHHYRRHRCDAYIDSNLPSKFQVIRP